MNSQLYTAASGLSVQQRRVDTISNNLANLSTHGFRAQRTFATEFRTIGYEAGPIVAGANRSVALSGTYENPMPGSRQPTGRPLDVALAPGDLLVVEVAGERRYTRDGSLYVSADGKLTDGSGRPVLNSGGAQFAGLDQSAAITSSGDVTVDGTSRGKLLVVRDVEGILKRTGDNLLTASGEVNSLETVARPELSPGWIERANTGPLQELVRLIDAQRAFESYQKLISVTMNEVNRATVNEIAR